MAEITMAAEITFLHPPGSRLERGSAGPLWVCGQAGVALDEGLARVWEAAHGKNLASLAAALHVNETKLNLQLAALRAGGLLLPELKYTAPAPEQVAEPLPLVSVVIVSRDGRHHLEACLPSLAAQSYPRLEVIVVDDASTDDTEAYVRTNYPQVRVVAQSGGPNFAAGCNRGIEQASGDLILLLNNDTVLDPHCVQELVAAQAGRRDVGGVAAMLRFYDNPAFVNGLGTFVPGRGHGHDLGIGSLDVGQFERIRRVPLLCFGAALIPRTALERVGPLHEAYRFYYEDADWGYRARALGLDLIAAPRAIVYHKFGASTGELSPAFKVRLSTRNRLLFAALNLPVRHLLPRLASHALEDGLRATTHRLRGQGAQAMAIVEGWREFLRQLPETRVERRQRWSGRAGLRRRQIDMESPASQFPPPEMQGTHPRLTEWLVENRYGLHLSELERDGRRWRVLIIGPDKIDTNMGGVGIRYWELAKQLSRVAQVTLAVPGPTALTADAFDIRNYGMGRPETLQPLVAAADIVVLSGFTAYHHPFLRNASPYIVVDLYDPTVLENLERFAERPLDEQEGLHNVGVSAYNDLFALGDYFICASEKQRDYWLGALSAAGRVNPAAYRSDPTLRRLIDVVPFGLPCEPPRHSRPVMKGVFPGIGRDDKVILWGGGLWDWLDPLSVIEAMPEVLQQIPEARLFFMGTRHPNPDVPPSRMVRRAIEWAKALGLLDRAVFFNDWVPYAERANYLYEADAGVSLHGDHIETRFAVRTRLMDYLWAGLPMVVTGGDTLSDLVAAHGLGRVVAAGDVRAVAEGLCDVLQSPADETAFARVAERFRWSQVVEPLVRYVENPWRNGTRDMQTLPGIRHTPLWRLPAKALGSLRDRGLSGLARDLRSYFLWLVRR